jgi:hypothetical protein
MAMAEIAITSLYVVTYSSWKRRSPSGIVLSSSWVTTMRGQNFLADARWHMPVSSATMGSRGRHGRGKPERRMAKRGAARCDRRGAAGELARRPGIARVG